MLIWLFNVSIGRLGEAGGISLLGLGGLAITDAQYEWAFL